MLLWSGEALSQLGSQAPTVAFPLLVLALTGSPAKAGIVGLAKWLPLAVAALPAGMLADRFAVAFLDGCLFTVRYVCERGALAHVVQPGDVPDAVASNEARMFAANIAGPPLGGVLFAVGRPLPFVADAGLVFGVDGVHLADGRGLPDSGARPG
jgi:hypothetical protein